MEIRALIPYIYRHLDIDNRLQLAVANVHTKTAQFETSPVYGCKPSALCSVFLPLRRRLERQRGKYLRREGRSYLYPLCRGPRNQERNAGTCRLPMDDRRGFNVASSLLRG